MSDINVGHIEGKIGVNLTELDLLKETDSRTMIDFESRTVFENNKNNIDQDEIQDFFRSKLKFFEPDLFSNKNNILKNIDMNKIDVIKLRTMLGLTQQKFAERIGVNRRTVVNWEGGSKIPDSKIKLLESLLEEKRSVSMAIPNSEKIENITDSKSLDILNREILGLQDHIETLKGFLEEKNKTAEFLKNENTRLNEKIALYVNKEL